MSTLAARLSGTLQAAGVPVVSVSIGDSADKATWTVQPSELQAAAQPIIDAFNPDDPAHETAAKDAEVKAEVDRRFMAAYSWVLLKRMFPVDTDAQTKTKLANMREAVVAAYLAQPWK